MKKSRLLGAVCAACLSFVSSVSSAALVEVDLLSEGDRLLTRDTSTDLDWLDITATTWQSINDVLGGYGGYIDMGFRFATIAEVTVLYENAGIVIDNPGTPHNQATASQLISLMGASVGFPGIDQISEGYAGLNEPGTYLAYAPQAEARATYTQGGLAAIPDNVVSFDTIGTAGSYLVRSSVVPIPPALWLFGSGLLGLVGIARRKANPSTFSEQ